ncbi:MAG TPA: DNRLRE domain-containing protein [bacterium]|nr:DNRLRE domain-containing protein [bacterium]
MRRPLYLFLFALLAAGCDPQSDNPLGGGLNDRPDQEILTLILEPGPGWADTGYFGYGNTDGALTDAVGRVDDTLVRSLVNFKVEDLPDEVTSESLYRARVEYYYAESPGVANWRPFSQGSLTVDVYAVTSEWEDDEATWLKRTEDEDWDDPGADYTGPFGSFVLDEPPSGYGEIRSFDVTNLVAWWLDNPDEENGLLLKAQDEDTARVIKEFYSDDIDNSSNRPHLVVVWESSVGQKMEASLEAWQDVIIADDLSQPDSLVYGSAAELPLSSAFGTGGRLVFDFDLSLLPAEATVNLAELELFSDFPGRDGAVGIAAHPLEDDFSEGDDQGDLRRMTLSDTKVTGRLDPAPPGYVKIDVTPIVQDWITGEEDQHGLVIKLATEQGYEDPIRLWTQEAVEGRSPRLVVKYTLPPDFWYDREPEEGATSY